MKVPGSKIVPCQGVLGSNHSLTFGLFTQVSGLGPLGPLVQGHRRRILLNQWTGFLTILHIYTKWDKLQSRLDFGGLDAILKITGR